jgi:uncharacterized ubiquitin-like protein YukD
MDFKEVVTMFSGLLTPFIGMTTVYIALQQWQTNRQKLILDLYDRRLRVYEEVRKIILIITIDLDVSIEDLHKFRVSVSEADFLFGSEVTDYINEIFNRGLNLSKCSRQYRDYTQEKPEGYDNDNIVKEKYSEALWLTSQFEPSKQVFKKYLDVSK